MIDESFFSATDLNLMVTFMAIYQEGSLTRAALKLNVKQPAVSGSLVRLRAIFGNELFVRDGRGMRPTKQADVIAKILGPAIQQIQSIIESSRSIRQPSEATSH